MTAFIVFAANVFVSIARFFAAHAGRTRVQTTFVVAALALLLPVAGLAALPPAPVPLAPIREFDVETLSRLGREIYEHDQLAWKATDIVFEQIGMERLRKDGGRGWIVDTSDSNKLVVRFIRQGASELEALCDVVFPEGAKPELQVPETRALTPKQMTTALALETAKEVFFKSGLPWCGGNPNTVVLDDPAGPGFLVYFLRAKPAMDQVPVGGHYRLSVSADGAKVTQIDRLFASCLTVANHAPDNSKLVALTVTHLVSSTPLETHSFLSLQEGLPFYVGTPDHVMWLVEKGHILKKGELKQP